MKSIEVMSDCPEWVEFDETKPLSVKVSVQYQPLTKLERFQETLRNAWNKSMNSMAAKDKDS